MIKHTNSNINFLYSYSDLNYTVIVPTNEAFYNYYPIDWGFNPFLVENFTKDVLLNHFMEGDIDLNSFNDSVQIQTIVGKIIRVTKNLGMHLNFQPRVLIIISIDSIPH